MPENIHLLVERKMRFGAANLKYDEAIKFAEKYRRRFIFDDNLLYQLGLLYDHKGTVKCLKKAHAIYTDLLRKNSKNFFALLGMARVLASKKRYQEAIRYAKRAYREKNKLPIGQKGALAIGHFYKIAGDLKGAERWYKKELKDLGGNESGAFFNLFLFYSSIGKHKKAYSLAFKAEELMKKEFEKDIYKNPKNSPVLGSKSMKLWKAEIQKAKTRYLKNEPNHND